MNDLLNLFVKELNILVDDYFKCKDDKIRDMIKSDIDLLVEALTLCDNY